MFVVVIFFKRGQVCFTRLLTGIFHSPFTYIKRNFNSSFQFGLYRSQRSKAKNNLVSGKQNYYAEPKYNNYYPITRVILIVLLPF